jgi:serine/threonine-protein kinase
MGPTLNPKDVRSALNRILASRQFSSSERMSRFLRYTVEQALAGKGDQLKETLIGMEVFDRDPSYDSRVDPIVRVEARRLRAKLTKYYETDGRADRLCIEFPTGGYSPVIRPRNGEDAHASVAAARAPEQKTIVVLPFANLSTEPDNDYFSDGLTQELIHALTKVEGLRVVAWNTASQLRGQEDQASEIGRRLQVSTLLQGSVRRVGIHVRITAQLIEAETGVYLWSETYDREMRDLLALQEELARAIVGVLQLRLVPGPEAMLRRSGGSFEAYNFYLKGRFVWNRRTDVGLRQSITFFERAIREDPTCALAFAGLADAYSLLCDFGFMSPVEAMPKAREAALKALDLDPSLAEAHTSLGFIRATYDWAWEDGARHYLRAIELNPGYATAHHWYGCDLLAPKGQFPAALAEIAIGRQLDPLDAILHESECYLYMTARRLEEAEHRYSRLIDEAPDLYKAYTGLGRTYAAQGKYGRAIELFEKGRSIVGDVPSLLSALGQVHAMSGNREQGVAFLARLRDLSSRTFVSSTCFALVHCGLGEYSDALDWLEYGCARRELPLMWMKVHPAYDCLRGEPRFQAILHRMGLAD